MTTSRNRSFTSPRNLSLLSPGCQLEDSTLSIEASSLWKFHSSSRAVSLIFPAGYALTHRSSRHSSALLYASSPASESPLQVSTPIFSLISQWFAHFMTLLPLSEHLRSTPLRLLSKFEDYG